MFETIVLGTDGSSNAERAAKVAGELAGNLRCCLVIVHVIPSFTALADFEASPLAEKAPQDVKDDIARLHTAMEGWERTPYAQVPAPRSAVEFVGHAVIGAATKIARESGAKAVESVLADFDAAQAIVDEADRRKNPMVVIGSRGLSNLSGLFMGSVSHKVIQFAPYPCLTVK